MTLRKKLVKLKNDNPYLKLLWFKRLARRAKKAEKIPDKLWIEKSYEKVFGKKINLDNPQTYYEKLNWLKLHYRNELMPIVADKYAVRQYLIDIGHGDLLNGLLGVWDNIDDFNPNELPERFVLKASHASGTAWSLIVKDKNTVNWDATRLVMREWLNQRIDWMGREWHYGEMKPRIICEKYLEDESGELRDYKFHCFNGHPKTVSIFTGRFTGNKMELMHDLDGNLLPYTPEAEELLRKNPEFRVPLPKNFHKMIAIAEDLCKPFPMVRIDFYNANGKIYFGEFTFFDGSALVEGYTDEAQRIIGSWLKLPAANHQ